jgi:ATP-dependent Lhr-like helicase
VTPVFEWFHRRYGEPTPVQRAAWPRIAAGEHALIVSPTGTGKTFAAFLSVLDVLAAQHAAGTLRNTIQCVYVSPLRALSYDLEKNLTGPLRELFGEKPPIRVELRTGDTTQHERARQYTRPPHILLTTPESLCLLLSQAKWLPLLAGVRWVIVDEIHAMADNKRGAHLALSIERLAHLVEGTGARMQRVGLSATVAPLDEIARFLTGTNGECAIIDAVADKKIELRVHTPLRKNPYPPAGFTGERLVRELGQLIQKYQTTLVFSNTRSGAEAATFWLKTQFPEMADQIECHHGSLERDVRREVEDRLKRGELRAVVCSTSLELGIDIGAVELVVMLATPKGVSKALQRAGRAGHNIHSISRGVLMATNIGDLVECCATVLLARHRQLDEVKLAHNALDVLAQQLVSMGCTQEWNRADALALVRRAWCFHSLMQEDFDAVLDYLAGGGKSLRQQYSEVFGKIDLDDEAFQTKPGRVRRDFLQNVGVIATIGSVRVRAGTRQLGTVDEGFARSLSIGDVFVIAGRPVRLEKMAQLEAWVTPADGETPTVPTWNANKLPLSNRVAEEIVAFRGEVREQIESGTELAPWIAERLDCGKANAEVIAQMHLAQAQVSEIPTDDFLLIEELLPQPEETAAPEQPKRRRSKKAARPPAQPAAVHYIFHSLIGRAANDALARLVSSRLNQLRGGNAIATPHDYGFVLSVTESQRIGEADIAALLDPRGFDAALNEGLRQSEMLRYHFRNAAQTGLMVYRNFFDQRKPARKLAWSSEVIFNVLQRYEPDHVLMREARRDSLRVYVDAEGAEAFLRRRLPVRLRRVNGVPPLAFAMYATKIREALLLDDPFAVQERLFHLWWQRLNDEPNATGA